MTESKVFFSNRVELLFTRLKSSLYASNSPFLKRLVIVPNPSIKSWIMLQLANDSDTRIAAGLEFMFMNQGLEEIKSLLNARSSPEINKRCPSYLELSLAIEVTLKAKILEFETLNESDQLLWKPLKNYLQVTGLNTQNGLPRKAERRLFALSEKLTHLFIKYGTYAGQLVSDWEMGPTDGWQQELWRLIYTNTYWTYPARELSCQIYPDNNFSQNVEVFIFAVSFLPLLQHQFLNEVSKFIPVHYFLLSPCRAFWLDVQSDWEAQLLLKAWKSQGVTESKQLALEEFMRDRNPLLANFGRLGREMASQVEDGDCVTFEDYLTSSVIKESSAFCDSIDDEVLIINASAPSTLLETIQADMLFLRNPDHSAKIDFSGSEKSIQLHIASSVLREVEILYHNLLGIIKDHSSDEHAICPQDIIVMAPDITLYEPYIKAIFGGSHSQLDFQLMDLRVTAQSSLVQGFIFLLNLCSSRWDSLTLIQLFEYEEFQRKHKLGKEDLQQVFAWIKEAGIRWGFDDEHRDELLKQNHCIYAMVENEFTGTWEHGISRLLLGFSMVLQVGNIEVNSKFETLPLSEVETTNGELLGKLIFLLRSLKEDLKKLSDGSQFTLSEWVIYLECLLESYFAASNDNSSQEELKSLKEQLCALTKASQHFNEAKFSFSSVKSHLEALLNKESLIYRENHLQAVRFCSMQPMRAIPAKVVCLLGMEEGAFPKNDHDLSLNLMTGHSECDYCPSTIDYDRFLFLEILLSARQYLLVHYSSKEVEQMPSLVVVELMGYLDRSYTIEKQLTSLAITVRHPFNSFDKEYFGTNRLLRNFSHKNYQAALAYNCPVKMLSHHFVPELFSNDYIFNSPKLNEALCIDLKQLNQMARNPLQTYFNKTLGIYLRSEKDKQLKANEPFALSALENSIIRKAALTKSEEHVLEFAEKEGMLPRGIFKKVALDVIRKEVRDVKDNLKSMGVVPDDIMQVEFNQHCLKPVQIDANQWVVPAVEINYRNSMRIKITGKLPQITSQGLIVHGKADTVDMVKAWPQYLLLHSISHMPISTQFLMTKSDKPKECILENHEILLERYVHYYLMCLENFSFLVPELTPEIMKGDAKSFSAKMSEKLRDEFNPIYNDYLLWALKHVQLPESLAHFDFWREQADLLYGDAFRKK